MDSWVRLELLAWGSFGSVYLAESYDGNLLAVKSSLTQNRGTLQVERQILESLHGCREIVQCYGDSFTKENGSRLYNLVLEYAPGGCLFDMISMHGGGIPVEEVACYTRMILKGLSAIHKKGLVHCDLKPENILVFPPNKFGIYQLKIADFGQTKFPGEIQRDWKFRFRGTPIYMSPESVAEGKIETALDVWSLGCVVIEMITGEKPWKLNEQQLFFKFVGDPKPPTIPDHISENAKDFLSKCFEMNPERRWTVEMLLKHPFVMEEHKRLVISQIEMKFREIESMCKEFFEDI